MGSILKRKTKSGTNYRAQVALKGIRKTKTFPSKAKANAWITQIEAEILDGASDQPDDFHTLSDALQRYLKEEAPKKKGEKYERVRINNFNKYMTFLGKKLNEVEPSDVAGYRDYRMAMVSPNTVRREMIQLSSVFTVAMREWGWCSSNPCKSVRRPKEPPPRDRVVSDDERGWILDELDYLPGCVPEKIIHYIGAAFCFALETAMRRGEIIKLEWKDVELERRVVTARDTKNGEDRQVPLSRAAVRIIEAFPHREGQVFRVALGSSDTLFRKAVQNAKIEGLVFHDTRRTALSRLSKVFSAVDLAKISGHKDLNILLNTYYKVTVDDLVAQLD